MEIRAASRSSVKIEMERLERRLDKLIDLHFSHRPKPPPAARRASSFFDLDFSDLKGKGAADLWRGVVDARAQDGVVDIRAEEQRITPWEEDKDVTACPLCKTNFHPLTNRKHHCRTCGRVICSLPPKPNVRPQTCSILFVADPSTHRVEEVPETIDYGVRKRTTSTNQKGKDEDKFLKGVRICRDCRKVLMKRQYIEETQRVPLFARLYEALISLEEEIEASLPAFQELLLEYEKAEANTIDPEATANRKRLIESFAEYDALAKRIGSLPTPGGKGSSQDRLQSAIVSRASMFLHKNMIPLRSLKPPKRAATPDPAQLKEGLPDPDSQVAMNLQPLLEQEAMVEGFIQEAQKLRKFEDVKTLKANLNEIRQEIAAMSVN
ncbi:hypothetical protein SISSUDRAFT_980929 [Sistotremastrum suecicum HHB10207 ss-3]|uniref:FYVE-type domain-containing protein n=1 Tax=Sistotremastrum suecicum HHB10207 ss-3 TaxID=1314776 RepID=A0A166GUF8_9AGAM|nr:hypothetical protein SISSUDRAFT_980929 [Sistotremastrum suecicum HHB10207 ss-3]